MAKVSKQILYKMIVDGFNRAEVLKLCSFLDYDEFDGEVKSTIVMELVNYCFRQDKQGDLLNLVKEENLYIYNQHFSPGNGSVLSDTKALTQITLAVKKSKLSKIMKVLADYTGEEIVTVHIETGSIKLTFITSLEATNKLFLGIEQGDAKLAGLNIRSIELLSLNLHLDMISLRNLRSAHEKLASDYRKQTVRLESAEANAVETKKHVDMLTHQLDQHKKTQEAFIFVTNQLRDTLEINQELKKRLAYKEDAPSGEVGLGFQDVEGLEPIHAIRLFEAGVLSPMEMREKSPEEIASIAGVSREKAYTWVDG